MIKHEQKIRVYLRLPTEAKHDICPPQPHAKAMWRRRKYLAKVGSHPRKSASITAFTRGFTLIELLISIAITVIIAGAIYLSLNAALDSWGFSKDKLALQKVLNDLTEEITNGIAESFGIKDGLEIVAAGSTRIEFVPPWTDDTHTAKSKDFVYTLDRKLKPGAATPITEVKLPEATKYVLGTSTLIDQKESLRTQVRLGQAVPEGSELRFTYHPYPEENPDVVKKIWWDEEDGHVYSEYLGEVNNLSKNPFGVKIAEFRLRYFDNTNNLVTETDWVDQEDLVLISGVEVFVTDELGASKTSLLSFTSPRNVPMRSGYIPLKKDMSIPLPDSHKVHILLLSNFAGVDNEDILELEAEPERGKEWRLKIVFGRTGFAEPRVDRYVIEYPRGHEVYTASPNTTVGLGLDLLLLDPSGLHDYDDDEDIEDAVLLEGKVSLKVAEMDIKGAGLFVRP